MNEWKDSLESCTVTRSTFNIEHAVTDFIKVRNRFSKSNYVHKRLGFIGCYYNQFFAQGFLLRFGSLNAFMIINPVLFSL